MSLLPRESPLRGGGGCGKIRQKGGVRMIRKYVFGRPFETHSCVLQIPEETGSLPWFHVAQTSQGLCFTLPLAQNDAIYGLGENVRGLNKRGFVYISNNVDDAPETEDKHSLYSGHNFLLLTGAEKCLGVYFDDPAWIRFDLGFTDPELALITSRYGDLNVYLIEDDTPNAVAKAFRKLIGRSYLPPKWGFGYIQSRFGEVSEEGINEAIREYEALGMPIDAFCIDIDGLQDYQNFTWDSEKFPEPERFVREKLTQGIHLVPIVDTAFLKDDDNSDYASGSAEDVFCKGETGEEFIGYVWPGKCVFPDYFQEKTRKWFGHLYQNYLRMGVHGFWNDMNEPSIFACESGFQRVAELAADAAEEYSFLKFAGVAGANQLLYDPERDGGNFCHRIGDALVPNTRVHNLYGAMMTEATNEGFREYDPNTRFLLFSRSSFIGSHRQTGVWLGDNHSWWSHLLQNLKWLPAMNLCGYLFTGADIGGFNGNTCDELMLRWLQLGIFTPLMRNHSAWGSRKQELFRFRYRETMAKMVNIRYALIPYLYSEFMKAALRDEALYRPLAFDYPEDPRACRVEDQVMLGGECMLCPIYEQNGRGRYVYLPEDMLMLRMRSVDDFEKIPMIAGDHYVEVALEELIFFVKKNRAIPMAKPARRVKDIDYSTIVMHGWLEKPYVYELYDDDGLSREVSLDHIRKIPCE